MTIPPVVVGGVPDRPNPFPVGSASYDASGQGSPEGQYPAAPGVDYADRTGAGGAWKWLKQLSQTRQGWIVSFGDTGWRQLAKGTAETGALGHVLVRMTTHTVHLLAVIDAPTSTKAVATLHPLWCPKVPDTQFPGSTPGSGVVGGLRIRNGALTVVGTGLSNMHVWASWPREGRSWPVVLPGIGA